MEARWGRKRIGEAHERHLYEVRAEVRNDLGEGETCVEEGHRGIMSEMISKKIGVGFR